jgi:hypothetical protein
MEQGSRVYCRRAVTYVVGRYDIPPVGQYGIVCGCAYSGGEQTLGFAKR